jgi:hypothetical protein
MIPQLAYLCVLIATGCLAADDQELRFRGERANVAVVHKGKLICLDEKGRFLAWDLQDQKFDAVISSKLAGSSITHLAATGDRLWGAGKSTVYLWSQEEQIWKKFRDFDGSDEQLQAIVTCAGSPFLVFRSKVEDVGARRTFKVPMLKGQLKIDYLAGLAFFATDSMLWIGTGYGEWGGHLVGLNPRTGEWFQYYDALHYVTGITQASPDEIIVSWSMSHFGADTLIRVHNLDGSPKSAYPQLDSKYYQSIVYNPIDKTLYGVENNHIVRIEEGKPSELAELKGEIFEREPKAIGVSPGIAGLVPIGRKSLAIFPKTGMPWLISGDGQLVRLVR